MKNLSVGMFTLLGIILGAMSLASLTERYFDVGLAPITQDVMDYYRWFMVQVRHWGFDWWTLRWFDFEMADWGMDLVAIWTLFGAATERLNHAWTRLFIINNWRHFVGNLERLWETLTGPIGFFGVLAEKLRNRRNLGGRLDRLESALRLPSSERHGVPPAHLWRGESQEEHIHRKISQFRSARARLSQAVLASVSVFGMTGLYFFWNATQLTPS
jgi:hypothetical protein